VHYALIRTEGDRGVSLMKRPGEVAFRGDHPGKKPMRELLYLRRKVGVREDRPGQLPSLAEIGRNIIAIIAPDSREVRPRELNLDEIRIGIFR
jgi:hypothetical protein